MCKFENFQIRIFSTHEISLSWKSSYFDFRSKKINIKIETNINKYEKEKRKAEHHKITKK
jgi:hypothetical protein